MGIAEQMGRVLQRTSISVNIKERLDFSCALFGPDGSLVANAPHLPVHLGARSEAVRFQARLPDPPPPPGCARSPLPHCTSGVCSVCVCVCVCVRVRARVCV
jgi:Hydantoinase B/oxoprolinase